MTIFTIYITIYIVYITSTLKVQLLNQYQRSIIKSVLSNLSKLLEMLFCGRVDNKSNIICAQLFCFIRAIVYLTGARLWGLFPPRALCAGVLDIERGPASIAALRRRRYTSGAATPRSPRPPWLGLEQS